MKSENHHKIERRWAGGTVLTFVFPDVSMKLKVNEDVVAIALPNAEYPTPYHTKFADEVAFK